MEALYQLSYSPEVGARSYQRLQWARPCLGSGRRQPVDLAREVEDVDLVLVVVPTVVVDDVLPVPGAQDLDFYRHVINKRMAINASKGS